MSAWDNGAAGGGLWGPNLAERNAAWSAVGLNPSGRYPGFDVGKRGIVDLMPLLGQQIGFMKDMEPIREQMIKNFITQNNPSNANYLIDASRRNAMSQATEGQNQMAVNGYGGGFTDPSAAIQAGNEAGSNAFSMVHSPEYQNKLYSNVLGGVAQGQDISGVQNAMQGFHNMTLSTPGNQSGLSAIGNILGQGLGQYMGGIGGQSSGGSTAAPPLGNSGYGAPSNYNSAYNAMSYGMPSPGQLSGFGQVPWF